jgi:hypothetical protein
MERIRINHIFPPRHLTITSLASSMVAPSLKQTEEEYVVI